MRFLLLALAATACAAHAAEATTTVVGRMVAARSDAPSVVAGRSARSLYVLHCAGCHGVDGAGVPQKYVPDLRRLGDFLRVDGGREFMIRVPGVMGSGLNDRQVADVMNGLFATIARDSVPAGHSPFTAGEIASARAQPLADVAGARERLVQQAARRGMALR